MNFWWNVADDMFKKVLTRNASFDTKLLFGVIQGKLGFAGKSDQLSLLEWFIAMDT